MRDRFFKLIGLLSLTAGGLMAQATPDASISSLTFLVMDSAGGPVVDAEVRVSGTTAGGTSGPDGRVAIRGPFPPRVVVTVRAVGFQPDTLIIGPKMSRDLIRVTLAGQVARLPEIEVTGRAETPEAYRHVIRMEGFYRRMRLNLGGYFIPPEVVKASISTSVQFLLAERAILGLRNNGTEFSGCPRDKVGIWIDGQKVGIDGLNLHTREVEAVEVYRRAVQIPAEFLDDSCAAIVIWTVP